MNPETSSGQVVVNGTNMVNEGQGQKKDLANFENLPNLGNSCHFVNQSPILPEKSAGGGTRTPMPRGARS